MNKIYTNQFSSIEQVANQYIKKSKDAENVESIKKQSFAEVLDQTTAIKLKFSKHANERLQSRNIDLTDGQLKRLESGAKKASEKGIKESLVLVDDLAFIVNVKNSTVVTAMKENEDTIITNIDGAVIM